MELVAQHGGYVTLTLTTTPDEAAAAARFVRRLAPGAALVSGPRPGESIAPCCSAAFLLIANGPPILAR